MIEEPAAALRRHVHDLLASVGALAITVTEDRPDGRAGHKFLQDLEDEVGDLAGVVEELREQADLSAPGADPVTLGRSLAGSHRCAIDVSRRLRMRLLDADRVAELRRLARAWGRPWQIWSEVVLTGLASACAVLDDVEDALLAAWSCLIGHAPAINREGQRL